MNAPSHAQARFLSQFRAATLPAVPKTLPKYVSDLLNPQTVAWGWLHVSCVVEDARQFRHAPESHACLSEVGKTLQQSVYQRLLIDQRISCTEHRHPQADLVVRHRYACFRFTRCLQLLIPADAVANRITKCRATSRMMRRWRVEVGRMPEALITISAMLTVSSQIHTNNSKLH